MTKAGGSRSRVWGALAALAVLVGGTGSAAAEDQAPGPRAPADKAPTISDAAPKDKPSPAPAKAKTAAVDEKAPFDVSELGPIDAATEKAIAALDEACVASPMSREGMTPAEEVRCNAAMARVVLRGKAGASAILTALNAAPGEHPYYARTQLYVALGKLDDAKVRGVLIDGLEKIGTKQLEAHASEGYEIESTLFAMMATGPDAELPWEPSTPISDAWEETKQSAARWRAVDAKWAGKKRGEILVTRLGAAKKEKTSDDPKLAYRAISYLVRQAPREAKAAATAYSKRKGLEEQVALAFEDLASEAEFRVTVPGARM